MSDVKPEDIDIKALREKLVEEGFYNWPVLPDVPDILQDHQTSYKILVCTIQTITR